MKDYPKFGFLRDDHGMPHMHYHGGRLVDLASKIATLFNGMAGNSGRNLGIRERSQPNPWAGRKWAPFSRPNVHRPADMAEGRATANYPGGALAQMLQHSHPAHIAADGKHPAFGEINEEEQAVPAVLRGASIASLVVTASQLGPKFGK